MTTTRRTRPPPRNTVNDAFTASGEVSDQDSDNQRSRRRPCPGSAIASDVRRVLYRAPENARVELARGIALAQVPPHSVVRDAMSDLRARYRAVESHLAHLRSDVSAALASASAAGRGRRRRPHRTAAQVQPRVTLPAWAVRGALLPGRRRRRRRRRARPSAARPALSRGVGLVCTERAQRTTGESRRPARQNGVDAADS